MSKWVRNNYFIISFFLFFLSIFIDYIASCININIDPFLHPRYIFFMWMGILFYTKKNTIFLFLKVYKWYLITAYLMIFSAQVSLTFVSPNIENKDQIWLVMSFFSISIASAILFYFILGNKYNNKILSIVNYVGELSFGIYIIHIFLKAIQKLLALSVINSSNFIFYIILFIGTLVLSLLMLEVVGRYKLSAFIFGINYHNKGNKQ